MKLQQVHRCNLCGLLLPGEFMGVKVENVEEALKLVSMKHFSHKEGKILHKCNSTAVGFATVAGYRLEPE